MASMASASLKRLVMLAASLLLLAALAPSCHAEAAASSDAANAWTVEEIDLAGAAGGEVGASDAHPLVARRRLQDGGWQRNSACYASQTCSLLNGTCLSATTYTTVNDTGCGTNKEESRTASNICRDTGCTWGGCDPTEKEVSSTWCWTSYNERCCKWLYTCRAYLSCTWVQPQSLGVFNVASGGSWAASATTARTPNAYIASILSNYMYEESLGVTGINAFASAFAWRVAGRMGATRVWVYYYYQETEWLFLDTPTSFIVVLRGTEGILSWDSLLTNLPSVTSSSTTDFGGSGVAVASGFLSALNDNKAFFLSELARFKGTSTKPLWFTGHSLGGALSVLFGAYAHLNGHPVQGIITFGAPIVGNANFKAVYPLNNRHYRYEVPNDPVPDLPGTSTLSYSSHTGILVSIPPCAAATAVTGITRRSLLGADDTASPRTAKPKRRTCGSSQINNLQQEGATAKGKRNTFTCPANNADIGGGKRPARKDNTVQTRGSGLTAPHEILRSYAANLYYCYTTSTEVTTVPTYLSITAL